MSFCDSWMSVVRHALSTIASKDVKLCWFYFPKDLFSFSLVRIHHCEVLEHLFHFQYFQLDWLQSLKQLLINGSYHILAASLTLMALFLDRAVRVRLPTII